MENRFWGFRLGGRLGRRERREAPSAARYEAVTGSGAKMALRDFNLAREDPMTGDSLS